MPVIGFNERAPEKDVWHIINDGEQGAAFTMIQLINRSDAPAVYTLALVKDEVEQGDAAVDESGELLADTTRTLLHSGEIRPRRQSYWKGGESGRLMLERGTRMALVISSSDLEVNIAGIGL